MQRGLHALRVKNFGILGDVEVGPLGRLNVLVGPNGSGKSSVLRVIQFLGNAARLQLPAAVGALGGLDRLRTRGTAKSAPVFLHISAIVTQHAHQGALDEYDLQLAPARTGQFIHHEWFRFKRTPRAGRRITLASGKLHIQDDGRKEQKRALDKDAFGLAVLPQLGDETGAAEIRKIQQLFTTFRVFDIDARRARLAVDEREESTLRANAANLAGFLHHLAEYDAPAFTRLLVDARDVIPGFADMKFMPVGGATAAVAVHIAEHHLPGTTPLADASFGTVRALALLALLHDPKPPLITCVEEIDHGLHPHVFDRLVELLREASARTQFIIATHSPALVNRLRPAELIVCERDPETGLARIPAADPEDVAAIHEDSGFGLGELWFSGTLGGVPR